MKIRWSTWVSASFPASSSALRWAMSSYMRSLPSPPARPIPALLRSTLTGPNSASTRSNASFTAALALTSQRNASARPGRPAMVSAAPASLRSKAATAAPRSDSSRVAARPMPWPAPVTTATLPWRD